MFKANGIFKRAKICNPNKTLIEPNKQNSRERAKGYEKYGIMA
jgi:hypothetical protein